MICNLLNPPTPIRRGDDDDNDTALDVPDASDGGLPVMKPVPCAGAWKAYTQEGDAGEQ